MKAVGAAGAAGVFGVGSTGTAAAAPSVVQVGNGGYVDGVPSNVTGHSSVSAPDSPDYATSNVSAPYPTNDWWSRLLTATHSETLFSHPIFTEPTSSGLEIGYTDEWEVGNGAGVDLASETDADGNDLAPYVGMSDSVYMPFEPDFTVGHTATSAFDQSLVDGYGDWHVEYRMGSADPSMTVTQVQGSPYLYLDYAGGGTELTFSSAPTVFEDRDNAIGVTIDGHHYGLFAPSGTSWSGQGSATLTNDLGTAGYVTIALLPDDTASTFDTFASYAHNHVTDTQIDWEYVEVENGQVVSEVRTTYDFTVEDRSGSGGTGTIAALYPHQHKYLADGESTIAGLSYESARGTMELSQGSSFTTALPYSGILPNFPLVDSLNGDQLYQYAVGLSTPDTSIDQFDGSLADKYDVPTLSETDVVDFTRLPYNAGKSSPYGSTYWTGLNYNRWSETAALLDEMARTSSGSTATEFENRRDLVLEFMQGSYEQWFTPKGNGGAGADEFDGNMFFYDNEWGTLTGHVGGFNTYSELNDHHFHYGYFVKGASEIARYGSSWTDESEWGGMMQLLIREFANPTRGDDMFPFLRNFSPYSGHSFASGTNPFHLGNNQEASSEAIDAYAGLIRWGAFTGQALDGHSIRDLGIFLYTHEIHAALEYWYDWDQQNHPDNWDREYASVTWGDGYSHSTWWTEDDEDTYAINVIPANGDSLYLGWDEDHIANVYDELVSLKGSEEFTKWPGILVELNGFGDPSGALSLMDDWESGNYPGTTNGYYVPDMSNSKLHTYSLLGTLDTYGSPTRDIVSDATFSHVFVDDSGQKNYIVYNETDSQRLISFSDGTGVTADANSVAIQQGANDQGDVGSGGGGGDTTPPSAPTGLSVAGTTDTTVDLTWTASSSSDVAHYIVYESGSKVAEATGTSTTVTGLASATELSLTLSAVDDAGNESGTAGPVTARTDANAQDYSQSTSEPDASTLSVSFTPSHSAASVDLNYSVDGGSQTTTAMSDGNGDGTWTATVSGLSGGQSVSYYFTFEKGGNYYDTASFSVTFGGDSSAPTAPTNLTSPAQTDTTIDLSWDASTDNVGVDHYEVYLNGANRTSVSDTTVTLSNLSAGTSYDTYVVAVDAAGNRSAPSATITVSTSGGSDGQSAYNGPHTIPGTIEAEDFDEGGSGVAYSDTTAGNEGGAYRSTDVDLGGNGSGGTAVGWTAAGEWLEYTVQVDADGTYDLTVAVASGSGGGEFHVEVDGSDVTGPITVGDTGGWDAFQTQTVSGISLTSGEHVIRLAVDSAGFDIDSVSFESAGDSTPPTAPANLTATGQSQTSIDLSWDAASDDGTGVDHYNVYEGSAKQTEVTGTTATLTGLSADTSYTYTVTAVDGAGNESDQSNSVTATTTPAQSAYDGPHTVPGTVQAEDFDTGGEGVAFHDTSTANEGGADYRSTAVDIEGATEGGYNICWTDAGEWWEYTVQVDSDGTYDLGLRVASGSGGGEFHVEVDGTDVTGTVGFDATGGWQSWTTISAGTLDLSAGEHVIRVYAEASDWNLNWLEFTQSSSGGSGGSGTSFSGSSGEGWSATVTNTGTDQYEWAFEPSNTADFADVQFDDGTGWVGYRMDDSDGDNVHLWTRDTSGDGDSVDFRFVYGDGSGGQYMSESRTMTF